MMSNNPSLHIPHRPPLLTLLLALLFYNGHALALSTDKDQPVEVEADSMEIDEGKGITIYQGNVEIQQGSIRVKADKVTIYQKDDANDKIVADGNPVRFRQRPDGKTEDVKGNAKRVHYYLNSELVYMVGDAELFPGDGHKLASDHITYDRVKAIMKAGAAVTKAGEKVKTKTRVRTTIAPRKKKDKKK